MADTTVLEAVAVRCAGSSPVPGTSVYLGKHENTPLLVPDYLARVDAGRSCMERSLKSTGFKVRQLNVTENGCTYRTYQVVGYLHGERVRKKFKDRNEALGEKNRLEVAAANGAFAIRPVNTRLSSEQLAEAEAAFLRLGEKSLAQAVDWFLENYRAPSVEKPLGEAILAFLAEHKDGVVERHHAQVRLLLDRLEARFSTKRLVHAIEPGELGSFMKTQSWGPKSWNNARGAFHAFFQFCAHDSRRWAQMNPTTAIPQKEVRRGLPAIETAEKIGKLFAFLESYTGGARNPQAAGFMVPYFALCTFAGIRPSARDGEIVKLARHPALARLVNTKLGVIQILPEISKTNDLRQIVIRPNLARWIKKYPLDKYPIEVPGLEGHATEIRKRFGLGADVLRHTFISAHVAKWKSRGEAALEAGNSESIIKKHYFNLLSESEAEFFWGI